MKNKTRKWIRGGFEILIHGLTAGLGGMVAAWLNDHEHFSLIANPKKALSMLGTGFALNGGIRFFQYWASNPLPPCDDSTPTIAGAVPQLGLSPLSQVQPLTPKQPTAIPSP